MKFLNDEYTLDIEVLADKNQIDKIRELVLWAPTPFSIGISGRWGSGKSSIMKYLMASLDGKPVKHQLNFQDKAIEEEGEFQNVFKNYCTNSEEEKEFRAKTIHTGFESEGYVEVKHGLLEGEEVVIEGSFLLDAQAQLFGGYEDMKESGPAAHKH